MRRQGSEACKKWEYIRGGIGYHIVTHIISWPNTYKTNDISPSLCLDFCLVLSGLAWYQAIKVGECSESRDVRQGWGRYIPGRDLESHPAYNMPIMSLHAICNSKPPPGESFLVWLVWLVCLVRKVLTCLRKVHPA